MAKHKMKTKRAAAKRYKLTGTGKVAHRKVGLNHLLSKKSGQRKRALGTDGILQGAEAARARGLCPYK